ncbi:cell division protein FtsQ/DivIB [Botrimarina mediterranea]|uniref:Cell division protein FtsQ n=1 Tax=Botrimarina mediterranea TaxID=2528022 RepID=A0A518K576_9BACT|nr:hypothetical protein [Botrimarina mediterranea]QDV72952.1 hypothetical protein Spa11_11390 [Botrimarina mediterranea]QDV77526.1 hypothetical protein K2D_11220 [Planctomycetes bacterium K2D]
MPDPNSAPSRPTPSRPAADPLWKLQGRRGLLVSFAVLAIFGLAARGVWEVSRSQVAHSPQYVLTPSSVTITPPPAWVGSEVTSEVFRVKGLEGLFSVLDGPDSLDKPLAAAYASHPWVRSVGAIIKTPPNRVAITLEYRRPLAAVSVGGDLVPVDIDGAILPTRDLSADSLRYLPRIELVDPVVQPPAVGDLWREPRLAGALSLVQAFGPAWNELNLFLVRIDRSPDVRAGQRFWSYSVVSTGNTVVVWGAAPGFAPPDEASFERKLGSLRRAVAQHGPLDSVAKSPALIDVREGGTAYPRVVMKEGNRIAAKDDEAEVK